ncbi:MAG: carboxypeptidase-like regulatory domain-containing protein, partial [Mangrovibacterium sp.]
LDIPRGNETLGYYTYDFNMMNYLEFVHDKYVHLYLEHHLNGFLFRRLPLLKKTDFREVVSAKILTGSISHRHEDVIAFPDVVSPMKNPYIELGAGVENIFKMFRVEAVWRLNSPSVTGAPSFGIRAKFEIIL